MNLVSLDEMIQRGWVELGRGKVISRIDMAANPGPYPIYSSAKDGDGKFGSYGDYLFDEELITWSVDGGGRLFHRPKHRFSVTNVGGFLRILNPGLLDYRYLWHALTLAHSRVTFDWVKKAHPSTIRTVYKDIPVPSLAEQKRIAAILDQAYELSGKRQRAIDRLNKLGQALFYEMFGDMGRLDRTHAFSDVATIQQSLVDPKLPEHRSELHVGPEHIASGVGVVAWNTVRTAAEDNVISGKNRFNCGDIIYSKIRPYLNKVAIADRHGLCSADMYVIKPTPKKSNAAFLRLLLMSADFLAYAETCSNRANIPKLNRKQVENYRFHCPPFDVQQEFADQMNEIELMSARFSMAAEVDANLFASLQQQAFRGAL